MTTPKPEPVLEMTGEDLAFLGDEYTKIVTCKNHDCETCPERRQFLDLIFRVEAGRRRAEFRWRELITIHPISSPPDPRHNRTPAEWLEEVEREVKGV